MPHHPNKHIREAIKYAEKHGWRVVKAGGQAHIWGQLYCQSGKRGGCIIRVFRRPVSPNIMRGMFVRKWTTVPMLRQLNRIE